MSRAAFGEFYGRYVLADTPPDTDASAAPLSHRLRFRARLASGRLVVPAP